MNGLLYLSIRLTTPDIINDQKWAGWPIVGNISGVVYILPSTKQSSSLISHIGDSRLHGTSIWNAFYIFWYPNSMLRIHTTVQLILTAIFSRRSESNYQSSNRFYDSSFMGYQYWLTLSKWKHGYRSVLYEGVNIWFLHSWFYLEPIPKIILP